MDTTILEQIGLTKGEIAVYLAMLELGSSTVGPIVDNAKVSYSKIYDILERLIDKGLVSYVIKDNKKYFEAAPVDRIMDYMVEKENKINEQKEKLKNMLPQLKLKQQMAKYAAEATIFKSIKGLETAYISSLKILDKGDELLTIAGLCDNKAADLFFQRFAKLRAKRGIKEKIIHKEKQEALPLQEIKYTKYPTPSYLAIFNDRVIIGLISHEILLFVIDNKEIAKSFKLQFESIWDQRVKTYEGVEEIRELWNEKLDYDEYCGLGEGTKIIKTLGEKFFVNWQKEKNKRNIKGKVLIGEEFRDSVTVKKSIAQFKFIIGYENPGVTEIFNDRIIVVNFSKKPIAFMIEDKKIAKSHQTYFDLLWKTATP